MGFTVGLWVLGWNIFRVCVCFFSMLDIFFIYIDIKKRLHLSMRTFLSACNHAEDKEMNEMLVELAGLMGLQLSP